MSEYKTSTTAYGVVCSLVKLAALSRWQPCFSPALLQFNTIFMQFAADSLLKRFMRWLPPKAYISLLDTIFIPGMTYHYLFRKKWIEEKIVKALAQGTKQVIVLGGGFDSLALRLAPQYPEINFFEIDLPATQRQKLQILIQERKAPSSNCIFISADLAREQPGSVLNADPRFTSKLPTIVVLEGVLMYLTEAEVKALFTSLRNLIQNSVSILFGATVIPDDANHWQLRLFNAIFLKEESANKWACASAAMPEFMAALGYMLNEWIGYQALQQPYRSAEEISKLPVEDENYYLVTTVA